MGTDLTFVQQKIVKLFVSDTYFTRREVVEQLDLHPIVVWKQLESLVRAGLLQKQRAHNGTNAFVYSQRKENASLEGAILTLVAALPWLSGEQIAERTNDSKIEVYTRLQQLCLQRKIKKRQRMDGTIEYASMGTPITYIGKHPRVQIVELLISNSWLSYNQLAKKLGFHPKTLSDHLHLLIKAQQVKKKKMGRRVYYALPHTSESVCDQLHMVRTVPVRSPSVISAKLLAVLEETPWLSRKAIVKKIGYSRSLVYVHLKKLEEAGQVKYRTTETNEHEFALVEALDDSYPSTQEKIVDQLKANTWLTIAEIAEKTGVVSHKVYKQLRKLEKSGQVKRRREWDGHLHDVYALIDTPDKIEKILEQRPFQTLEQLAEQVHWSRRHIEKHLSFQQGRTFVKVELAEKVVYCTGDQRSLLLLLYRAKDWVPAKVVGISLQKLYDWSRSETGFVELASRGKVVYVKMTYKGVVQANSIEKKVYPEQLPLIRLFLS
jgi:predicted ArsR family transcriptional regulator